jgi:hypothetical protein
METLAHNPYESLPQKLQPLARLHPNYTHEELEEAYDNLRRYVEIGWQIALRLEREGRLDDVLTKAGIHPTVKRPTNQ